MPKQKTTKPDFICIGPTKTGTSWLYTVLRLHPAIWLPPVSEINYFWGYGRRLPRSTTYRTIKQRIMGDIRIKWRRNYARERWQHYHDTPDARKFQDIAWDLKYLFLPQTPSWYLSLFRTTKIAGDITGGYFTYDDRAIETLARHLPDAKIIMSFRDPVSRLWSEARMMLLFLPGKTFDEVTESAFFSRFDQAYKRLPSYYSLYVRWCKYFPKEQVMMCYYDDLLIDPVEYLRRICDFLQVPTTLTATMQDAVSKKIFEGPRVELPDRFRKYLIEKTLPCVEEMAERTGDPHPHQWLNKYRQMLGESNA